MDPRKVYQRPPSDTLTTMQMRGLEIVDRYIENGEAAMLTWFNVPPHKAPNPDDVKPDDLYRYLLLVRQNGAIYEITGWQDGRQLAKRRVPVRQWKEDWVLELARREGLINIDVGGDEELPLDERDYAAIGLSDSDDSTAETVEKVAQPSASTERKSR